MSERVRYTIQDGVADVRLCRPEKRNAIDLAMLDALIDAAEALAGEPTLRAVVLSGAGTSFCAGLDEATFAAMAGSDDPGGSVAAAPWPTVRRSSGVGGAAGGHGLVRPGGAGHRGHPWPRTRRRPPAGPRRRHPYRGARRPALRPGDPVGLDPRHDRHPGAARPGGTRCGQGADLHGPDGERGGGEARMGPATRVRPAPLDDALGWPAR